METRITCAIAEAIGAIAGMAAFLMFIAFIYQSGVRRQNISSTSLETSDFSIVFVFVAVALMIVIGNNLAKRTGGQNVLLQSGIPPVRTRVSRLIKIVFYASLAVFPLALSYDLTGGRFRGGVVDAYFVEIFVLVAIFGLASGISAAQERLSWVLDLRAQQGHAITFKTHPMAAPMTVENDWWKKPTP
ncbi:MAG: hypothetical protein O9286_10045 [Aquidulcibacter sp.]|nr:hypothetical protein [Aquidulcibacter sp.]